MDSKQRLIEILAQVRGGTPADLDALHAEIMGYEDVPHHLRYACAEILFETPETAQLDAAAREGRPHEIDQLLQLLQSGVSIDEASERARRIWGDQ